MSKKIVFRELQKVVYVKGGREDVLLHNYKLPIANWLFVNSNHKFIFISFSILFFKTKCACKVGISIYINNTKKALEICTYVLG